jgi:hypothetical protein
VLEIIIPNHQVAVIIRCDDKWLILLAALGQRGGIIRKTVTP